MTTPAENKKNMYKSAFFDDDNNEVLANSFPVQATTDNITFLWTISITSLHEFGEWLKLC